MIIESLSSPPPTVQVTMGVLKHSGADVAQPREQRWVWFVDGILPNGEVANAAKWIMNGISFSVTLALSHNPVKPVTTSLLPTETDISLFLWEYNSGWQSCWEGNEPYSCWWPSSHSHLHWYKRRLCCGRETIIGFSNRAVGGWRPWPLVFV